MPVKGYTPQTRRPKFPLSVAEQKRLVNTARAKESAVPETLLLLMLSTGMHPKVLVDAKYDMQWNDQYCTWMRPKTKQVITVGWSKAMKELDDLDGRLKKLKGSTRQWYFEVLHYLGKEAGVQGFCPLQARHTNLVNRARLGHNAFDIAMSAATDLDTVYQYYMIGAGESKGLGDEDREWLRWLIEA